MSAPSFLDLLHLSYVDRWVIAPTYRRQSVAEHTFRVMAIAAHLASCVEGVAIADVMRVAMEHDAEERLTGDLPGPSKDRTRTDNGGDLYPPIIDPVRLVVKVADAIETGTFWIQWGNADAWRGHPLDNAPYRDAKKVIHYGGQYPGLLPSAKAVWNTITGYPFEYVETNSLLKDIQAPMPPTSTQHLQEVLKERGATYGPFIDNARPTQRAMAIFREEVGWYRLADDQRQAIDVIAHKLGRILSGDPEYVDNWDDIAGYALLISNAIRERARLKILEHNTKVQQTAEAARREIEDYEERNSRPTGNDRGEALGGRTPGGCDRWAGSGDLSAAIAADRPHPSHQPSGPGHLAGSGICPGTPPNAGGPAAHTLAPDIRRSIDEYVERLPGRGRR